MPLCQHGRIEKSIFILYMSFANVVVRFVILTSKLSNFSPESLGICHPNNVMFQKSIFGEGGEQLPPGPYAYGFPVASRRTTFAEKDEL